MSAFVRVEVEHDNGHLVVIVRRKVTAKTPKQALANIFGKTDGLVLNDWPVVQNGRQITRCPTTLGPAFDNRLQIFVSGLLGTALYDGVADVSQQCAALANIWYDVDYDQIRITESVTA
jgi:hypothetical protein